jgi:RNA polymerase-binding protein DksA
MEQAKSKLLELKAEYEQRVENTEKHLLHREEPVSQDFAEQAVELENEEVVERLDEEAKHELALVNAALARIESGDYGVCVVCGCEINEARLAALPHAAKCIDCAD